MDLTALIPLAIGSAVVPIQIVVTVLLLRGPGGRATGGAWVAGMLTVRLAQGIVFGILLADAGESAGSGGPGLITSVLLLLVAILLYAGAAKQLVGVPDEDAPPPRWMASFEGVSPGRAFLMGAGLLVISVKFWAFTLGALAVIEEAQLGPAAAAAWYLGFTAVALSVHLSLLLIAWLAPARAEALLGSLSDALARFNRQIVVVIGIVFGTWFLIKALGGLGVL